MMYEELKGILNNKKHSKSFRYSVNSWSFYQLQTMIEYKSKLLGVTIAYIDHIYTSKTCRCGHIGNRNGKNFECPDCGQIEHANAVLVASITHFGKYSIKEMKEYLASKGIPVKL